MNAKNLIVITGPTASGKSRLALEVALKLGAPIISADSRQIYRGIPITTAVPTIEERELVKHHLIEILELDQYYSAATFYNDAKEIIDNTDNEYIIVCGGSMMYIDALIYGLDDLPTITAEVRTRVSSLYAEIGLKGLIAFLENLDEDACNFVDVNNPKRVMHAVEICLQTGNKISRLYTNIKGERRISTFNFKKFVIRHERHDMFNRINQRVENMVKQGMESEARSVYHLRHLNSLNTIGFKEWFAYFDGILDRETTISRIAKNTRVYAKKQLTWLARQNDNIYLTPENTLQQLLKHL